jgi:hypothetical protein
MAKTGIKEAWFEREPVGKTAGTIPVISGVSKCTNHESEVQDGKYRHQPEFHLLRLVPEEIHCHQCPKWGDSSQYEQQGLRHPPCLFPCLDLVIGKNTKHTQVKAGVKDEKQFDKICHIQLQPPTGVKDWFIAGSIRKVKPPSAKHILRMRIRGSKETLYADTGINFTGKTREFSTVHLPADILTKTPA